MIVIKSIFKNIFNKLSLSKKPGQDSAISAQEQTAKAGIKKEKTVKIEKEPGSRVGKGPLRCEKPGGRRPDKSAVQPGAKEKYNKKPWDLAKFEVPEIENRTRFHDLKLPNPVMHAIFDLGFQYCTPIQAEILPSTLAGRDATGRAQTGTGKTAAFLITVITKIIRQPLTARPENGTPRVLILGPTRELVMQIADEARDLAKYCSLNIVSVFGGMDYEKQRRQLTGRRVDIVVATPGRLLDFNRRHDLHLRKVEVLIIDEADRMLDMGFIPDVRRIVYKTPPKAERQTMLFSATLTPEVIRLTEQWTRKPVMVEIEPEQVAVESVEQIVYTVTTDEKFALLYNIIVKQKLERVLIFCNRRDETRRLGDLLSRHRINCALLSGEINQKKRVSTLEKFKAGKIRALVATDVAGRGIHIESMPHVINYTLPRDPEDYVHRIGRTGRAGETGTSISFACEEDSFYIPPIEEFIGNELHCVQPDEEWLTSPPPPLPKRKPARGKPQKKRYPRRGGSAKTGHGRPSGPRRKNPRTTRRKVKIE